MRVSRIIVVFETSEPCRKPAPFGKGRARMPDVERPKALHGRKAHRAFINVQRMHDSGRTESAQGRADPNDRKGTDAL